MFRTYLSSFVVNHEFAPLETAVETAASELHAMVSVVDRLTTFFHSVEIARTVFVVTSILAAVGKNFHGRPPNREPLRTRRRK